MIRTLFCLGLLFVTACNGDGVVVTDRTDVGTQSGATGDTGPKIVDADSDGFSADEDCNDADPAINPDALEVCDGLDNNCDRRIDEVGGVTVNGANFDSLDDGLVASAALKQPVVDICPRSDPHYITPVVLAAGSQLTVRGVGGSEYTQVGVNQLGTAFTVQGGASLVLEGLTLNQFQRRPVEVTGNGSVTVRDCKIDPRTGGILVANDISKMPASLLVEDSEIRGVALQVGKAVELRGLFSATLRNVDLDENIGSSSDGSALTAVSTTAGASTLTLDTVSFKQNVGDRGGALFASGVVVSASNTEFVRNEVAAFGGALHLARGATFDGNGTTTFRQNSALEGGAVYIASGQLAGVSILDENDAERGGGIAVVVLDATAPVELTNVQIEGNVAYEGGGLYVGARNEVILDKSCTLHGNTALKSQGGGAFLAGLGSVLESQGATWSDGASVNTPADVEFNTGSSLTFGTPTPQVRCSFGTGSCEPL